MKNINNRLTTISNNNYSLNKKSKNDKNNQNDNLDKNNYPIPEIKIVF